MRPVLHLAQESSFISLPNTVNRTMFYQERSNDATLLDPVEGVY